MVIKINIFCQAEDGIRYIGVTGVQTCALPILDMRYGDGALTELVDPDDANPKWIVAALVGGLRAQGGSEIGRASCRERVYISVVAVSLKKKIQCRTICIILLVFSYRHL